MKRFPVAAAVLLASLSALAGEPEEDLLARLEWFQKRYAFPADHVPPGARLKAFQDLKLLRPEAHTLAGPLPSTWQAIGPAPIKSGHSLGGSAIDVSGRVNAIAIDPVDDAHWLVGSPSGGLWQTFDSGKTWTAITDALESVS
ncbi:MAG TPA: hypothetical protein VKF32_14405, partial [Thermoanaerobaculia bacterium]|nr:hypothetical protein [Thermoanaerobaculia bacterium]